MRKATATYVAPFGDNKVVEMGGVTFFDGKPVEINSHEHPHLISKLQQNAHFDVVVGEDDKQEPPKAKRGRPTAAMVAEAKAKAEAAEQDAKEAAKKAKEAKADSEAAQKAASAAKGNTPPMGISGQTDQQPQTLAQIPPVPPPVA